MINICNALLSTPQKHMIGAYAQLQFCICLYKHKHIIEPRVSNRNLPQESNDTLYKDNCHLHYVEKNCNSLKDEFTIVAIYKNNISFETAVKKFRVKL